MPRTRPAPPRALPAREHVRVALHALIVVAIAERWWASGVGAHLGAGGAPGAGAALAGAATLTARLAGWVLEALAHAVAWRACGARLRAAALLGWLPLLSSADLLAASIARGDALPAPWAGALAGPAAADPIGGSPGLAAAFGSCGALALARVVATADVERRLLGVSLVASLAMVGSLWLASRLILWWTTDLLRGRSPL